MITPTGARVEARRFHVGTCTKLTFRAVSKMARHETPEDIAAVLARFAPRRISRLLDPAVGGGRLIEPLLERLAAQRSRVVCLDVDGGILNGVARSLRPSLRGNLRTEVTDFLEWSSPRYRRRKFDCIVMNPPFLGRKQNETQMQIRWNGEEEMRNVSVEAAFTIRSLGLLAAKGVLLSVLPASLISGKNAAWIRQLIMSYGRVVYVHELPAKAFQNLEARLYLLAFERDGVRRPTLLCNHDLMEPERLWVKSSVLVEINRWDYAFHEARLKLDASMKAAPNLGWKEVGQAVSMSRGSLTSPGGKKQGIHTSDFRNGVWRIDRIQPKHTSERECLRRGDLLIRRVGRHCSQSAGIVISCPGVGATDCVLVLRPKKSSDQFSILLGLRTILGSSNGASHVEHGTSATYIAEDSLRSLRIPMKVKEMYPRLYRRYVKSIKVGDGRALMKIEDSLRKDIGLV
jgi:tRNA1(Val) A37 N6-methylase TrmN6